MKGDMVTLYCPAGDGTPNSHTVRYKGIKEFVNNGNGTISFRTQKYGKITTPLYWRLSEGIELNEVGDDVPAAPKAPKAGNQQHGW